MSIENTDGDGNGGAADDLCFKNIFLRNMIETIGILHSFDDVGPQNRVKTS